MKRLQDKWLITAAAAAMAIMFANVWLTYRTTTDLRRHSDAVVHTHRVVDALNRLLQCLVDAETGQRGFVITNEEPYLEPYREALARLDAAIEEVQTLTRDNATQQARMPELRRDVDKRLQTLAANIELRREEDFDAVRNAILTNRGKQQMDAVRRLVGQMRDEEGRLLEDRIRSAETSYRSGVATDLLGGFAGLSGVAVLLISVWQNLAARKRALARIAQQRELLETTLASIGDAVITTDADARVTYLNAVAERLTGWTQAEARGELLDVVFAIVNETTRLPVDNPAHRALRDGVIVGLANHTVLLTKDGREVPIDDSAAPIRGASPRPVGCVLVFRDVSTRRDAERALRESEAKFRSLVEQVRDYAIFRIDGEGRATTWNAGVKTVLGYDEDEFLGADVAALIFSPEDQAAGVPQRELDTAARIGSASDDRWMVKKGGVRFWAAGVTESVRDEHGRLLGFAKVMRDRTEAKQMEDELRQFAAELSEADRRKNEFLAMLAHELRNPLAPIRNAVEIIRRSGASDEQTALATEMMQRQVGQMVRLIDDLLDVSRVSRGAIELRLGRVEVASVVNSAVDAARTLAQQQAVELLVTLPQNPIYVDGDPARLQQIVGNLLSNACKFSQPGGQVRLGLEQQGETAVLRVVDDGIGIAADHLTHIFDMFMQVDTSLERTQSGLGIGLTLVKRLVELHGGSVEASSPGLGRGSQFVVRLPCAAAPQASPPPSAPADGPLKVTGRRILVVDDNVDSAQTLAMLLKIHKNDVHQAHDGEAAVALAEQLQPDAVLLDIGLPKLNGFEAARRIRAQPWGAATVLIALTGWGQDDDRRQSLEAGFDGHLVKPVDHGALIQALADALAGRPER